jgi:hypothetical protein
LVENAALGAARSASPPQTEENTQSEQCNTRQNADNNASDRSTAQAAIVVVVGLFVILVVVASSSRTG